MMTIVGNWTGLREDAKTQSSRAQRQGASPSSVAVHGCLVVLGSKAPRAASREALDAATGGRSSALAAADAVPNVVSVPRATLYAVAPRQRPELAAATGAPDAPRDPVQPAAAVAVPVIHPVVAKNAPAVSAEAPADPRPALREAQPAAASPAAAPQE